MDSQRSKTSRLQRAHRSSMPSFTRRASSRWQSQRTSPFGSGRPMVGGVTGRERISGLTDRSTRADVEGESRFLTVLGERTEGLAEGPVQAREAALIETKRDRAEVHLEHTTTATGTFDANQ